MLIIATTQNDENDSATQNDTCARMGIHALEYPQTQSPNLDCSRQNRDRAQVARDEAIPSEPVEAVEPGF